MRLAGAVAMASGLAVIVGLSLSRTATAADDDALEGAVIVRSVATTASSSPAFADSARSR